MEVLVMNYYWISTNNDKVSTVAYAPKREFNIKLYN